MNSARPRPSKNEPPPKTPNRILPVALVAGVIIVGAVAYKHFQTSSATAPVIAAAPVPASETATTSSVLPASPPAAEQPPSPTPAPPPKPLAASPPPVNLPPADPAQLLARLTQLNGKDPITPEQAAQWKEALQQLIRQGPSAVKNIQQLLAQNQNVDYAAVQGQSTLGYNSLRGALIDALGQIGGADATSALLNVMQSSVYPTDVQAIAKILDADPTSQYQPQILAAVNQQLGMASLGQLGDANVGPLYQVLTSEGVAGANVISQLANYSEKWPYYSSIALASLPNDTGVPVLIQMAQGTIPGTPAIAAQALAELASQNSDALNTLVQLAGNGQLSDTIMAEIAPYLGGRVYQLSVPTDPTAGYTTIHMAAGNQDFASYAPPMTTSQITAALGAINQVLQNLPANDYQAQAALQQQQSILQGRLPK